jgi:hypothetical protein
LIGERPKVNAQAVVRVVVGDGADIAGWDETSDVSLEYKYNSEP